MAFALGAWLPGALAEPASEPTAIRTALAQTDKVQGAPGQWLVEQPSHIHEAAVRGTVPVVIYLATLLKSGSPPSTPVTPP